MERNQVERQGESRGSDSLEKLDGQMPKRRERGTTHSFIHSFIQQTGSEDLLRARLGWPAKRLFQSSREEG